jgi:hypothetical protein
MKLISNTAATTLRNDIDKGRRDSNASPYGNIEKRVATGRAYCRACGNKILKGQDEITFIADFSEFGCGSHTATQGHIHYSCT